MTIEDLYRLNEKFQKSAVQLAELLPVGALTEATTLIIRNARQLHPYLEKVLQAKSELEFGKALGKVEEYMDEIIFILDQLELGNKEQKIRLIDDFVKEGFDLLSIYSVCVDQIIKEKVANED